MFGLLPDIQHELGLAFMGRSGVKKEKWVEGTPQLAPRIDLVCKWLGGLSESILQLAEFSGSLGTHI